MDRIVFFTKLEARRQKLEERFQLLLLGGDEVEQRGQDHTLAPQYHPPAMLLSSTIHNPIPSIIQDNP